ncbi:hypothetical protein AN958_02171 [Leucoagaricus sp. SymC.cos]|nr:hypothetical protein AN958_02171 [Leucoagaricus sp. SymC.cos]
MLICSSIDDFILETEIYETTAGLASTLVEIGLLPCAPFHPSIAFTTCLMELFHTTHLQCPHLSAQAFVKSLCDLHGIEYQPSLLHQFSISYDLYLSIKNSVQSCVMSALNQGGNWHLCHACPACTYKLEGKPDLIFEMLIAMDGNNSLKQVLCWETTFDREGNAIHNNIEIQDERDISEDYYLSHECVDRWVKDHVQDAMLSLYHADEEGEENLLNEMTVWIWAVFDEMGVFLALCHHGFVLVILNMVHSGEIHMHNCICQLSHLTTYIKRMGLENLKGCEHFFSRSNALASSTQYASVFHQWQSIIEFLKHMDSTETLQNLSQFLVQNYHQALDIIKGEGVLKEHMAQEHIRDKSVFDQWLQEERAYLTSLQKKPVKETLAMDYYQSLVDLEAAEADVEAILDMFHAKNPSTDVIESTQMFVKKSEKRKSKTSPAEKLQRAEAVCKHCMDHAHVLEEALGFEVLWTKLSSEYQHAAILHSWRCCQQCLDELKALVISHLFELTKMNMSNTSYKLCKHIVKALHSRSQAITNTLKWYNAAASALDLPRQTLTWNQVVQYAFLSEFDLLRDSQEDVHQ